jgi:L-alanine-DL-glutamate epimerase-like enolase superfamily enzyme
LSTEAADAIPCVQYIEQPTHRDLESHPETTMHRVAKRLPVVIDESLVDLRSLRVAVQQGYSGIALKACKGHAEALLLGAVACHEQLFLCVQDLTCVGASLLHSASLAAHIPGVAAVESNGRQYSPAGNQRWLERFGSFFQISDGAIPTGQLDGPGLGYGDDPALA